MSEMLPPIPPPPPPVEDALPWERSSAGLGSIVATMGQFIGRPLEAFAKMSLSVDLVRPIVYYVILVLLGSILGQLWNLVFLEQTLDALGGFIPPDLAEQLGPLLKRPGALQIVLGLVVTPLVMLVILFVWAAIVHAGLVLLGGAGGGFSATLRAVCYARTSDVASVVPLVGGFVAFFWRRILEVAGLSTAHKSDAWKSVIAILLPLVLCCVCVVAAGFAFGAAIAQALKQLG